MKNQNDVIKADLPIDIIDPNPDNNMLFTMDDIEGLARAIKTNGFRGAIEVYLKGDGRYEIIAGHRRVMAAKSIGLASIPSLIYPKPQTESEKRNLLVDSNIYNRKFNILDWANAINYHRETLLMQSKPDEKTGLIWDELSEHFGMARGKIYTYLSVFKLIPEIQALYVEEKLPFISINIITSAENIDRQPAIYEKLIEMLDKQSLLGNGGKALSVAQVNMAIDSAKSEKKVINREYNVVNPGQYYETNYTKQDTIAAIEQLKTQPAKPILPLTDNSIDSVMEKNPFRNIKTVQTPQVPIIEEPIVEDEIEEPIAEYEIEEEEVAEPIDMALNQLAIQLKRLTEQKFNIQNRELTKVNIELIKKSISSISKLL